MLTLISLRMNYLKSFRSLRNYRTYMYHSMLNGSKCLYIYIGFLGPHPQHIEAPRLGVESELQLPAYTTATVMQDLSCVSYLHHSSWQRWILNPLREARD